MRNWFWYVLVAMACQLPTKNETLPHSTTNEYAQFFSFQIKGADTTLCIFFNGDTTIVKNKEASPGFYLGSTTQWGYFDILQLHDNIRGMTFPETIQDSVFQEQFIQKGRIKNLQLNNANLDWEWLTLHPTHYFLYSPFDESPCARLSHSTTQCIPFCDYLESHPLGRLEWIKVIGWLNGRYDEACRYFSEEKTQYESQIEKTTSGKVLMGSFDGSHFWINSQKSHIHQIIKDSGHTSVLSQGSGNKPLDKEQLWDLLPQVQHVILMGTTWQSQEAYKQLSEWESQFGITGYYINTSTTAYFEKSPLHPSQLLKNLKELPNPKMGYLQKIH